MNLRNVDLNLLVALRALLTERSVSRAAQRLYITQPAASNALRRLRTLFQDPLLVRAGDQMELTPRALGLISPVNEALATVEGVFTGSRPFDPFTATFTLHMAVSEYAAFVVMPALVQRLREEAPGVRLVVRDVDRRDPLAAVRAGKADLLAAFVPEPLGDLRMRTLFRDAWVCIRRQSGQTGSRTLSRAAFASAGHISLPMQTGGSAAYLQRLLADRGITRHIAVSMPHYLSIPQVVSTTDLMMTIPSRIARELARQIPLQVLEPPIRIPTFAVSLVWHERTERDSAHQWVRTKLQSIAAELTKTDMHSRRAGSS